MWYMFFLMTFTMDGAVPVIDGYDSRRSLGANERDYYKIVTYQIIHLLITLYL